MSSHPLARPRGSAPGPGDPPGRRPGRSLPEKTEVILGGMITNVQLKNVQKSRSGLTRMAKLTFEDLSGTTPAMLWPEEFAKMADLVKNDQIVFVKGTLDRRRDPPELIVSRIIPARARARRADPRSRRPAAQGAAPDRTPRAPAPRRSGPARQPRPLSRDRRPGTGPPRHLQGGRIAARSLRRPAGARPGGRRRPRPCPPARPARGDRTARRGHGPGFETSFPSRHRFESTPHPRRRVR